jgi:hypothetical protein
MATIVDDRRFVIEQWQYLYGRLPTASDVDKAVSYLQAGQSRATWLANAEKKDAANTITRLFKTTLGRLPTEAEMVNYVSRFRAGTVTRKTLTQSLAEGVEGQLREAAGPAAEPDPGAEDALSYLQSTLDEYGLGSLGNWAWEQIQNGYTPDRVIQNLRQTKEYQVRFAGMEARRAAGLSAISEGEYIAYERDVRAMMRSAGMPESFYDEPSDFANFIGNDVSPAEMQARINDGFLAASQAPAEVREQLQSLYGISGSGLAAYFLDPDRALPLLQRQFSSAQISGAASRTGYGALGVGEAERLAELGVSAAEAQQGFSALEESSELFNALPGETAAEITRAQQQAAIFEGDADARSLLRKRGEERVSQGSGAQSFSVGQGGVAGLGTDG